MRRDGKKNRRTLPLLKWHEGHGGSSDYPGRAVAGRTLDPHYRSETVEEIPPSSEGVAFKPATFAS